MRVVGVLNSAMVWRQAPQGSLGALLRLAMAMARMRMWGPCWLTAAAMAACSAQVVRRYEAFSTLQPETMVFSGTSRRRAAPTRKWL